MRERIQRRKKKTGEGESQLAPPPLQPAYFDEGEGPQGNKSASEERGEAEPEVESVAEVESQASGEESPAAEVSSPQPRAGSSRSDSQRKGRRRRGGRGRGGRGREQAVAAAFTPAASKGIISEVAAPEIEEGAEGATEAGEPEPEAMAEPQAPAVPAEVAKAPARPPKGIVVLAIGLPGSGKSTWFKRHNVVPLSSDMVRSLLFDDVREQRFQDLVFSNLRSLLKARLIAKRPTNYVDATNLTPQERQHWIKLAKDYNYEVQAVFFDVPLDVCIERHNRRDRVVPDDVMRRMAAKLKPPAFDEGFAKITVVRVKKKAGESAEPAEA